MHDGARDKVFTPSSRLCPGLCFAHAGGGRLMEAEAALSARYISRKSVFGGSLVANTLGQKVGSALC